MNFLQYDDEFIGLWISTYEGIKLGHDITINANPVMTMYPKNYTILEIEVDVYL